MTGGATLDRAGTRSGPVPVSRQRALEALSRVRDPELDEPITELGFVSEVTIDGDQVGVRLRLPTYFCAPNFAFLMAADARAAVWSIPGVRDASVVLEDHFASKEINGEVAGGVRFEDAFPRLADGELGELRSLFARKAMVVRQERVARGLLAAGRSAEELAQLSLGDLPASATTDAYLERRAALGLEVAPDSPFLVRPNGEPIEAEEAAPQLRFARTVRVSIEGNADMCRSLLRTRYGLGASPNETPQPEGARR